MSEPEDYCELMDMPASMCAHCRGSKSVEEEVTDEVMALRAKLLESLLGWITASYPGRCCVCGSTFLPGTAIRFTDVRARPTSSWIAECCAEEASRG